MDVPDVVYLVRDGDDNAELRHSLRSLAAHLPHRRVWLAGYQPTWTTNVGRIPVPQRHGLKWPNQAANLAAACAHPDVTPTFVLFNDDFFVMRPLEQVPVLHRGPLAHIARTYRHRPGEYPTLLRTTSEYLGPHALAYDAIHVPMIFDKARLGVLLDGLPDGLLFRSVYGNRHTVGGTAHPDVKIASSKRPGGPTFVSTSDAAFRRLPVGHRIREQFPQPCRYETSA